MKTMAKTFIAMMAVVAVALLMAVPAMAWQPADESQFSKPLNEDGVQLINVGLPVVDMQGLPDEMDEGAIPGCDDLGDPDSLNCPGEEGVDEGDDEGIDDGGDDEITPGDTPEDTPGDDTPDLTPPEDTPGTSETPPVTPPTTTTTSNLPKTGTYLLALAGIGMIVALGSLSARVIFARRMR